MKKNICITILFIASSLIFAMSNPANIYSQTKKNKNEKTPAWITKPYSFYDESKYLAAVGSGKDDNCAEEDAKAELIKVLKQDIDSTENINQFDDTKTFTVEYNQQINATSKIKNISGLKITEKFYADNGTVYALAILNRQEAAENYAKILKDNDSKIVEYLTWANSHLGTIQACMYGNKALSLGLENEYYKNTISDLKPPFAVDNSFSYGSYVQLKNQVAPIVQSVQVRILVDGDEKFQAQTAFNKTLQAVGIGTSSLPESPYTLKSSINIQDFESPDSKHYFCNYSYNAQLISKNGQTLFTYSSSGRAGHINKVGAKNKAFLLITKDIESAFLEKLKSYAEIN